MSDAGLNEETPEIRALIDRDYSTDGTIATSRAHSAEQELQREGLREYNPYEHDRARLIEMASNAPAMLNGWSVTPLDDRLVVEYASFREGYVCTECQGEGHTNQECDICHGKKTVVVKDGWKPETCGACRIIGSDRLEPYASGFKPCEKCGGTGLAPGVFAIPETSQQDHSYGDILSCGAGVYDLRPGDRVVFSKMAGIYVKGDGRKYCLLRRGEVMGYMRKVNG